MIDFVQIGAFTGHTALQEDDIIWPLVQQKGWRGICIEPLPSAFEILISNYANISDMHFENVAITEQDGTMQLYHQPSITFGTCSLNPNHFDGNTQQTTVKCVTFDYIVNKYNLKNQPFKLLQIDTEGWDGKIIRSINFNEIYPKQIRFEHSHLTKVQDSRESVIQYLQQFGYEEVVDIYYNGVEDNLDTLMEKQND